ncbi:MAG: cupin domain-containing protein [Pseudomonadota bacterium]
MYKVLLPLALAGLSATALAETTLIDTSALPAMQVYDVAELTPLAVSASGAPAVVLLDLDAGDVVPPHATQSGLRLLTVLSGEMSWGDGSTIDQAQETVYPAGSILTLPAGQDHWLAARSGDVRLQLIVLDDENAVPEVLEQMQ